MEPDEILGFGYDFQAGIIIRNPNLMWYPIGRRKWLCKTDDASVATFLTDTSYDDDVVRILLESPVRNIAVSGPGEEDQSAMDEQEVEQEK